jgi:ParB family chromosome partitioning protein
MGRRVNLAELATDDLDLTTSRAEPAPAVTRAPGRGSVSAVPDAPAGADGPTASIEVADDAASRSVPIGEVALNPLNKRPPDGDDELEDLADTIRAYGVIQPLVVCSAAAYLERFPEQADALGEARWVVLIGNRRLRAARLAEQAEVTILVNDEQVTSMYEVMLVENGQRRDLPAWLEAEAMAEVLGAAGISQRALARRIGKSAMYITHRLALLKLVRPLRVALEAGELSLESAREFGELPEAEQEDIATGGLPYRRRRPGGEVTTRAAVRSIRVSSPAVAAASIRKAFSAAELAEFIRLLTEPDLDGTGAAPSEAPSEAPTEAPTEAEREPAH